MITPFRSLAPLIGLLLACCGPEKLAGGAGAGNPPLAEVTLAFTAKSLADTTLPKSAAGLAKNSGVVIRNPDGTFTIHDASGSPLILTAIEADIERIRFELPENVSCKQVPGTVCDSGEVAIKRIFNLDLMTGKATPALDRIQLPEGLYRKAELGLVEGVEGHSNSGDGSGSSKPNLVIKGHTDSAQGSVKAFALKLDLSEGLDFEKPDGFRIAADSLNAILIQLSVDNWLQGVELVKCIEAADPASDSAGVRILSGDGLCGGEGLRIRRNIEASGEIDKGEEEDHVSNP
jgi:hypothetical protein